MSNNVALSGTLIASPQTASETTFPAATINIPFNLLPASKPYGSESGAMTRLVNSPSSFFTLGGIGPAETVTQGQTLFLRTVTRMQVRVTTHDGLLNADVVSVLLVKGLFIYEIGDSDYLKLLEAQGTGVIEWWVGGLQ